MQRSWQNRFLLSFSSNPSEILEVNTARPQPVHELGNSCYVKQVLIGNRHTEPCLTTISSKQRRICGMYPWVLRGQTEVIARQLSIIFERSWQSQDIPEHWKKANFTPIYKKSKRTEEPQASQPHFSAWEGGIVNPLGNPLPNTWRTRWLEKDGMDLQRGNQA